MYQFETIAAASGGGSRLETRNPADRHSVAGRYLCSDPSRMSNVVGVARAAQRDWAALSDTARLSLLNRFLTSLSARAQDIARSITIEQGKPLAEAQGEIAKALDESAQMLASAGRPGGAVHATARMGVIPFTLRRPRGVIAALTPWNFPALSPLRKIVPALAFGNAIILKPSELSPAAACIIAEVAGDVLPRGLFQLVIGGAEIGRELVSVPGVDGITFTGSVATGKAIYRVAADNLAELSMELGGKNAAIIHDVSQIDRCLDQVAGAAFLCSGQRCTAISRVIVRTELAESVIEGLAARARSLVPGDGLQQGTTLGPLISDQHLSRVAGMVASGVKHGARIVAGGGVLTDGACANGYFYAPTVLCDVTSDNPVAQEEIFGPVISVLTYDTLDEAMQILNDVEFGLTAALFSSDITVIDRFIAGSASGMIHVNHGTTPDSNMPFVGIRNSGVGACSVGPGAAAFYTTEHAVYLGRP
jgi:aldehyde dehydrogenase (NAD+)